MGRERDHTTAAGGAGILSSFVVFIIFYTLCSYLFHLSLSPLLISFCNTSSLYTSLPVSLNSGTTSNDSMEQSTAENGGKKKKKKKEEELQSLNVNWACSESLGDDVR